MKSFLIILSMSLLQTALSVAFSFDVSFYLEIFFEINDVHPWLIESEKLS